MDQQRESEFEAGKMFIGGLSWETDEASMSAYFQHFGELEDCVVMRDPLQPPGMKRNRGFGFVKFKNQASVDKVEQCQLHMVDNKKIDPKRAVVKGSATGGGIGGEHVKKAFVGGLARSTTQAEVKEYFEGYLHSHGLPQAVVEEVDFKKDRNTERMRGFAFVAFDSVEARDKVIELRYHKICGKTVETTAAEPRGALPSTHVNPPSTSMAYNPAAYQQQYSQGDYSAAANNGQQYQTQFFPRTGATQPYYPPYNQAPQQAGYGPGQQGYSPGQQGYGPGQQGYGPGQQYSYDQQQAYPRTQSSTGNTQDSQSYYQQPYGHAGGQQLPYGPDTSSYNVRSAYPPPPPAQDNYGQQLAAGYGRGAGQQQPHYGAGPGGYGQ